MRVRLAARSHGRLDGQEVVPAPAHAPARGKPVRHPPFSRHRPQSHARETANAPDRDATSATSLGYGRVMDLQLHDRVILVVGGHGLIGGAVVARLRAEGATAIAASRHAPDGIVMDAADDESVAQALDRLGRDHGRLDGLVVAAAPSARTLDASRNSEPEQVLAAFDAKAMTFLRVANAVVPRMRDAGYGRIVGVSGQNAFLTGNITGSVRNAALVIVAKNLADSLAGSGVTVNSVSPSIVSKSPSRTVEMGRSGECSPDDVAALIALLVSPLGGSISGESIGVGHRVLGATHL